MSPYIEVFYVLITAYKQALMMLDFPLRTVEVSPGTSRSSVELQGQAALTEARH